PIVAVLVGRDRGLLASEDADCRVPVFGSVEPAIAALGHAVEYSAWRNRPAAPEPDRDDVQPATARRVVLDALVRRPSDGWLDPGEIADLLARLPNPVRGDRRGGQRRSCPARGRAARLSGRAAGCRRRSAAQDRDRRRRPRTAFAR